MTSSTRTFFVAALAVSGAFAAVPRVLSTAHAATSPAPSAASGAPRNTATATATATSPVTSAGPLPANADPNALPPGHPGMSAANANAGINENDDQAEDDTDVAPEGQMGGGGGSGSGMMGNGTGNDAHAAAPGIFQPPEDIENEAADLPAGTIAVTILDADGRPIPHAPISLGILHNSIAKGDSREKILRDADASGSYIFPNLTTGSGIAYRISSQKDGGTYAVSPFQLPAAKGMRVVLHVYDASARLEDARIVMQTAVYVEMKDDRVQIEEIFAIFNFGRTSWLPGPDLVIPLPPESTAFNTQQEMSDTGADAVLGQGVKLHGTFGPGRHDVTFRWQLPYSGDPDVRFDVGLPPHVASSRVLAAAAPGMHLEVEGFPTAQFRPDAQGTRVLATERSIRPNDPALATLHVALRDLPTAGPGRFIATGLASIGIMAGFAFVFGRRGGGINVKTGKGARKFERARLLGEIEDLEHAYQAEEIGPKTYEKARRELIEALALTLSDGPRDGDAESAKSAR